MELALWARRRIYWGRLSIEHWLDFFIFWRISTNSLRRNASCSGMSIIQTVKLWNSEFKCGRSLYRTSFNNRHRVSCSGKIGKLILERDGRPSIFLLGKWTLLNDHSTNIPWDYTYEQIDYNVDLSRNTRVEV